MTANLELFLRHCYSGRFYRRSRVTFRINFIHWAEDPNAP